jgi:hypothetical protein
LENSAWKTEEEITNILTKCVVERQVLRLGNVTDSQSCAAVSVGGSLRTYRLHVLLPKWWVIQSDSSTTVSFGF